MDKSYAFCYLFNMIARDS